VVVLNYRLTIALDFAIFVHN